MASSAADDRDRPDTGYPLPPTTPPPPPPPPPPQNNTVTGTINYVSPSPVAPSPLPPVSPPPIYLNLLFREHRSPQTAFFHLLRNDQVFLHRMAACALALFFFLGCLTFLLWITLRPRPPQIHVASAHLTSLSTTTDFSAACSISLLLTNPNNRLTIFYDSFDLYIYYSPTSSPLSSLELAPFVQPKRNDTLLRLRIEISIANAKTNDLVKDIKEDLNHESVNFGIKVLAWVRLDGKEWRTKPNLMTAYCADVALHFSAGNGTGTLLHPYQQCLVSL